MFYCPTELQEPTSVKYWVLGNIILQNIGILPQHCMPSQLRKPWLESSSPWKPQIMQCSCSKCTIHCISLHSVNEIVFTNCVMLQVQINNSIFKTHKFTVYLEALCVCNQPGSSICFGDLIPMFILTGVSVHYTCFIPYSVTVEAHCCCLLIRTSLQQALFLLR